MVTAPLTDLCILIPSLHGLPDNLLDLCELANKPGLSRQRHCNRTMPKLANSCQSEGMIDLDALLTWTSTASPIL